jgi:hypothetical protein
MAAEIDYVEVERVAHELAVRHGGHNAAPYAKKLAQRARDDGDSDQQAFREALANR